MITVYGIPNCDTVKKARAWLAERGVAYRFHDFKKQGVPPQLDHWVQRLDWDVLLNRKGTTWRKLDETTRARVVDAASALAVMREHASTIKRPVVDWGGALTVGFDAEHWASTQANTPAE